MNPEKPTALVRGLAGGAGALDFGTGIALVVSPGAVQALMGVAPLGPEALVFLRWVGAFVAAVGFSYLWAVVRGDAARLRHTLEFTIWFRLAAGGYSAWAVATGVLSPRWVGVPVTDLGLAAVQAWWVVRGRFRR